MFNEIRQEALGLALGRADSLIRSGIPMSPEAIIEDAKKFESYLEGNDEKAPAPQEVKQDGRNDKIPGYGDETANYRAYKSADIQKMVVPEDLLEAVTNYVVETGVRATNVQEVREMVLRLLGVAWHNDRGAALFKK